MSAEAASSIDRWALVTGASRGLGRAVTLELLARGWRVHGLSRGAAGIDDANYSESSVDLGRSAELEALLAELRPQFDRPDLARVALINNAGLLAPLGPASDLEPGLLAQSMAVQWLAPLQLTGYLLRTTRAPLRIVNLSSGAAHNAYPGWTAYCSAKAALRMAGLVLATELEETPALADRDVRLLSYAPHVVATDMQTELRATDERGFPRKQRFVELHEQGELVPPEDPARDLVERLERDFDGERYSEVRFEPR